MDERTLAPTGVRVAPGEGASRATTKRRTGGRAAALGGAGLASAVLLAGCGADQPYSSISPRSEIASDIQWLYQVLFWGAFLVFVLVQAFIVYTALKFHRRNENQIGRPEQVHGNRRLEILWTAIPAVVLLAIFIPTAQTMFDHADAAEEADIEIDVYGNQWWWEFHYPDEYGNVITANELRLPLGKEVAFNLRSNNVIHSFWVPQLAGKMDVVPGKDNRMAFEADRAGEYWAECAEFCGVAHAWMRFRVIVEPEAQFDAWVAAWHEPPPVTDPDPRTADIVEVPPAFAVCIACHNVSGTNAQLGQNGINANPLGISHAPNLTLFACRDTLGAGVMENTRENIITWIKETKQVKEGNYMPNYYEGGRLTDQQVEEIADYLLSLEPAAGCPVDPPVGGDMGAPIVAAGDDPAATPAGE